MKLWTSLLQAQAAPGSEYEGDGAYVKGLTLAASAREAEAAFEIALWQLGWKLVSVEDTHEFTRAHALAGADGELERLAPIVYETGQAQFGAFHAWSEAESAN
jgi:hypothetical protein